MDRKTSNLRVLLVFVVLAQFGFPITEYGRFWTGAYMLLYVVMLVFGVLTARDERQPLWFSATLAVAVLTLGTWGAFNPESSPATFAMFASIGLFLASLIVALLRFIFDERPVGGADMIVAAVCVYLLLGGLFTALFGVVETLDPGAVVDTVQPEAAITWQQLLYYSYVTMGTLGYGEILPVASWARSLAIIQTATGSLFLAIVVARLVGVYTSSSAPATEQPET